MLALQQRRDHAARHQAPQPGAPLPRDRPCRAASHPIAALAFRPLALPRAPTTGSMVRVRCSSLRSCSSNLTASSATTQNGPDSSGPFCYQTLKVKNHRIIGGWFFLKGKKYGAPEKIRTSDLQLRRLPLYPAELRARTSSLARSHRVDSPRRPGSASHH